MLDHNYFFTVASEMLLESTLQQLKQKTDSHFDRENGSARVRITNKTFHKMGDNRLLVKSQCTGETSDYNPQIMFDGVEFADAGNPEAIALPGGIHVLPIKHVQVKVSCTCLDFHWTFAWYNAADGSLIGTPPKPYDNYSGQRNPSKTPGLCKHLIRLQNDLQAEGLT